MLIRLPGSQGHAAGLVLDRAVSRTRRDRDPGPSLVRGRVVAVTPEVAVVRVEVEAGVVAVRPAEAAVVLDLGLPVPIRHGLDQHHLVPGPDLLAQDQVRRDRNLALPGPSRAPLGPDPDLVLVPVHAPDHPTLAALGRAHRLVPGAAVHQAIQIKFTQTLTTCS